MRVTSFEPYDLDDARRIVARHYYANHVEKLCPSDRWRARFTVSPPGALTIGDLYFGTDVTMRFGELGAYHVDVPLSGRMLFRQGGGDQQLATSDSAAVFQPVGDTVLDRWSGDCRLLAVKIDRALLEDRLAKLLDAPVAGPVRFEHAFDLGSGSGRTWARLVRLLTTDATGPDRISRHPRVEHALRDSLVTGLLLAAGHQYRHRLGSERVGLAAPRTVRAAIDAMRAQPARPFTLADLAATAGVSARSLQLSFQRYVGMPPMRYLRQLRLGLAHDHLLRAAGAEETVAQIAYQYGFTHLGRFAAAYRRRYGVPPGVDLRR